MLSRNVYKDETLMYVCDLYLRMRDVDFFKILKSVSHELLHSAFDLLSVKSYISFVKRIERMRNKRYLNK